MEVLDALDEGAATSARDRELSILFHYYVAREPNRTSRWVGLHMHDALQTATSVGVCASRFHLPGEPIDKTTASRRPTGEAWEDAAKQVLISGLDRRTLRRRHGYRSLEVGNRVDNWKLAISSNRPVLANFFLTRGYERIDVDNKDATLEWPVHESSRYSHAVAILGFDNQREAFRVRDSRGPSFGDKGCWWFPFRAAERLVRESYAIETIDYS